MYYVWSCIYSIVMSFSLNLQLATIIEQDRSKAKATVETGLTKEVTNVHFDDICEYVGDVEDY